MMQYCFVKYTSFMKDASILLNKNCHLDAKEFSLCFSLHRNITKLKLKKKTILDC